MHRIRREPPPGGVHELRCPVITRKSHDSVTRVSPSVDIERIAHATTARSACLDSTWSSPRIELVQLEPAPRFPDPVRPSAIEQEISNNQPPRGRRLGYVSIMRAEYDEIEVHHPTSDDPPKDGIFRRLLLELPVFFCLLALSGVYYMVDRLLHDQTQTPVVVWTRSIGAGVGVFTAIFMLLAILRRYLRRPNQAKLLRGASGLDRPDRRAPYL